MHKLLILCCALYLSGAHWVVLQTTAWTGMLISRSMATSVAKAIETTFDGQHPCRMCSAIADGKRTEHQSEKNFDLLKKIGDVKFVELASVKPVRVDDATVVLWPVFSFGSEPRFEAPPTPPPLA